MTDTESRSGEKSNSSKAADKAGSLWGELGPSILFILFYAVIGRFPDDAGLFAGPTAIYWATGALMAGTGAVIIYKLVRGEKLPPMLLISGSVVGFFGALTIALQNATFAYIKPTIVNLLFAVVIFGGLAGGTNLWRLMFKHVFDLPNHAWTQLAIRWGLFFIFLALWNEFLWRMYCPLPENPLTVLGLTIAPAQPYSLLGLEFGTKDAESVWAWWKIGNIAIIAAFGAANVPYTMKHLRSDDADTGPANA